MIKIDYISIRITYLLFVIAWIVGDMRDNINDDFKYVFMFFLIAIGFLILLGNLHNPIYNIYDFYHIMLVPLILGSISVIYSLINGMKFLLMWDMFYLILPYLMVFIIVNIDQNHNRDFYYDSLLIGHIFLFFYKYASILDLDHIKSISFTDSFSPYESVTAHIYTLLFYYYYVKNKKVRCLVALFFGILSYKRLHVVFAIAVLLLGWTVRKKVVGSYVEKFVKAIFISSPLLLYALLTDNFATWFLDTFEIDFGKFTMGRFDQLREVVTTDIANYGLGSIKYYFDNKGAYINILHSDIMRILLETSIIGLVVLVYAYFNVAKKNIYSLILMIFIFMIMFTSTVINGFLGWFLVFLSIDDFNRNDISNNKSGVMKLNDDGILRIKFRFNR
ncbi:MAG: hypothetical protein EWM47_02470 [Anaerolineaceae bacterium]|nr:MAG: hypothetical protein EWM47_02470 [Anaerolineaceae bacterium]